MSIMTLEQALLCMGVSWLKIYETTSNIMVPCMMMMMMIRFSGEYLPISIADCFVCVCNNYIHRQALLLLLLSHSHIVLYYY